MQKFKFLIYILIFPLIFPPLIETLNINYALSQGSVNVTATIAQTTSCTPATTTTAFGNIDSSNIFTSSPNITITVSCNANAGCTVTIKDQGNGTNGGLWNSSESYLIPSPATGFPATATLVAGTDGYGVQAATTSAGSGASLSLNLIYTYTGNTVGKLATTTQILASSSSATSQREVVVTHKAAVSALAPAGSYADTITYACSAN